MPSFLGYTKADTNAQNLFNFSLTIFFCVCVCVVTANFTHSLQRRIKNWTLISGSFPPSCLA